MNDEVIIFHNPKCSKSRQTLQILKNYHLNPVIIEYLKAPLTLEKLRELRANFDLKDFVRVNEPVFTQLNLTLENEAQILEMMQKKPILMQRPIVTYNGKSIIARPPEKVLELID